jgi:Flp pilus assembly protein TadG
MLTTLRHLFRRRDGAISILSAVVLPALLVIVGLAVEYGNGLLHKVRDQRVADSAAFAAATVYSQNSSASLTSVVDSIASLNGLSASNISASLVTSPSGDGSQAVQVTVTTSVPLLLSQALGNSTSALTATATSYAEIGQGNDCVLVLNPASSGSAATISGGTETLNCGMQVNSSSSGAFTVSGGAFSATTIDLVGQMTKSGGTVTGTLNQSQASVSDPYTGLYSSNGVAALVNQSCPAANNNWHSSGNQTLSPGVYCNGWQVSNSTITLQPGVYIFQGGNVQISGGTLNGTGVTFIMTCKTPPCTSASNNWAVFQISGGTNTLSAPTSGSWSGMLIYQDQANSTDAGHTNNQLSAGTNSLQGVIYFPNEALSFSGGGASASCTQIVAWNLSFSGGGTVNHNCSGTGVSGMGAGGGVKLVQ